MRVIPKRLLSAIEYSLVKKMVKYMRKMISSIVTALCIACPIGVTQAGTIQWGSGSNSNNHWYETVVTPDGISWTDANSMASSKGGYLVTIRTQEEQDFVTDNALVTNYNPDGTSSIQTSFWMGAVSDVTDPNLLSAGTATTWSWTTGESWDFDFFSSSYDADGLDSNATGNVTGSSTTGFEAEVEYILAQYGRISAYDTGTGVKTGGWSDQPDNGFLDYLDVDFLTGDINNPLAARNYMYGYVIEYDQLPPDPVPEPATMLLFGTGIAGLIGARVRRKK